MNISLLEQLLLLRWSWDCTKKKDIIWCQTKKVERIKSVSSWGRKAFSSHSLFTQFFLSFNPILFFLFLTKQRSILGQPHNFSQSFLLHFLKQIFVFSKGFLNEQKQRVKVIMGNCRKRKLLGRKKMRKFETDFYRIRFNSINHHIIDYCLVGYYLSKSNYLVSYLFSI